MATYFGDETITGNNWDSGDIGYTFGLQAVCPGSGPQNIVDLGDYLKGGVGNVRLAVYDAGLTTLMGQGSAEVAVGVEGWYGHISFTDVNGNPITPQLTGGVTYYICASYDNVGTNQHYISGGSTDYGTSRDYTVGYPASITLPNNMELIFTMRCGVDPPAGGIYADSWHPEIQQPIREKVEIIGY